MYEGMSEEERAVMFHYRVASDRFYEQFEKLFHDCIWRITEDAFWAASCACPLAEAAWGTIVRALVEGTRLTRQELDELRSLGIALAKAEKALAELAK